MLRPIRILLPDPLDELVVLVFDLIPYGLLVVVDTYDMVLESEVEEEVEGGVASADDPLRNLIEFDFGGVAVVIDECRYGNAISIILLGIVPPPLPEVARTAAATTITTAITATMPII